MTDAQLIRAKDLKSAINTEINKISILEGFLNSSSVNITTPNNSSLLYNLSKKQLTVIVDELIGYHNAKIKEYSNEFDVL